MATKVESNRNITKSGEIIDAVAARRKATGFASNTISHLLLGRTPELVEGPLLVWRVPIVLTFFDIGEVGEIGTVDVDAATGEVVISQAQIDVLKKNARDIARRTPARPA